MKKIFSALATVVLLATSCSDTRTYADLVNDEEKYIGRFLSMENIRATSITDETLNNWTNSVLKDSVPPSKFIEKGHWYTLSEGNFKRLYFRINEWGPSGDAYIAYRDSLERGLDPKVVRNFRDGKFRQGSYAVVRYDSLFNVDSKVDINKDVPSDNYAPFDYEIVMNWSEQYYATSYYGMYGSGKNFECTSGGLGFPLRFLWYGGQVSLIVPFSLVSQQYSSYYFTLYYGKVTYTNPESLPE